MQEEILLQAYAGADGSFTLYEDAGDGYGYEKGAYCVTQITYCDKEQGKWNGRRKEGLSSGEVNSGGDCCKSKCSAGVPSLFLMGGNIS